MVPSILYYFFINSFMFTISARSSSCIECIVVNPFNGCVDVTYKNGYEYSYFDVSRRSILNLMLNKNMSLGFWVNANCIPSLAYYA